MIFGGLIQKLLAGKAADVVESEGKDLQSGKVAPMNPKTKAWLEGALWAFVSAFIPAVFQGGIINKQIVIQGIGTGLTVLAAYVRQHPDIGLF